jgi:sulfonate transport system substrate-binding protein
MAALSRSDFLSAAGAAALAASVPLRARAAGLDRVGLDYAYYNPPSLVLKSKGWLEEALSKRGTSVEWVLSLGSNKANQFLQAGVVQFGSTAGSAALLARANGSPIKTVFLYSRPEWTALVAPKDYALKSVRDLKGKKVAATRGTDPWFFLLRSLQAAGLAPGDVELVDLQHPDGRTALERGQVDAWAGLDPHMAASQLDAGSRLLYRNVAFNTWGALNIREDFLAQHSDVAAIVLRQYDRARKYAASHVEETAALLSDASHTERRVADLQLRERTSYPGDGTPGSEYHDAIAGVVPLIRADKLAKADADLDGAVAALIDARPAATALRG